MTVDANTAAALAGIASALLALLIGAAAYQLGRVRERRRIVRAMRAASSSRRDRAAAYNARRGRAVAVTRADVEGRQ